MTIETQTGSLQLSMDRSVARRLTWLGLKGVMPASRGMIYQQAHANDETYALTDKETLIFSTSKLSPWEKERDANASKLSAPASTEATMG